MELLINSATIPSINVTTRVIAKIVSTVPTSISPIATSPIRRNVKTENNQMVKVLKLKSVITFKNTIRTIETPKPIKNATEDTNRMSNVLSSP